MSQIIVQVRIVLLPDRSASNSLSLIGTSALAQALLHVTVALNVVAAFVFAYTIAGVVVYQSNGLPFIIAARAPAARIFPNGRRLCMIQHPA